MTRAQVARYLGRSIATVRRVEGHHLHPYRDAKGVFRFDPDEVRALRTALDRGALRLASVDFRQERQAPSVSQRHSQHDVEDHCVISALRQELGALRDLSRAVLHLFYSVCPPRFLSEIDSDLLDALDHLASKTGEEAPSKAS
jgi:hypothetical protein